MTIKRALTIGILGGALLAGCDGESGSSQNTLTNAESLLQTAQAQSESTISDLRMQEDALSALKKEMDALATKSQSLQSGTSGPETELAKLALLAGNIERLQQDVTNTITRSSVSPEDISTLQDLITELQRKIQDKSLDQASRDSLLEKIRVAQDSLDQKRASDTITQLQQRQNGLLSDLDGLTLRQDIPLTQYVNPFIGTQITETGGGHSGNVNPGAQTPFGMVSFGPDTKGSGSPWGYGSGGYYYKDETIQFFSMTHLNGPGCRGESAVAMMPLDSALPLAIEGIRYSKDNQSAEPGLYKVKFDNGILSELTATPRTGMMRITYPDKDNAYFLLDASRNSQHKGGGDGPASLTLGPDGQSLSGQAVIPVFCGGAWKQPLYFYALFDKKQTKPETTGQAAAILKFDLGDTDRSVTIKIGISSVSVENAKLNLDTENPGWSFDATQAQSSKIWNARLNAIQLDIARPEELAKISEDKKASVIENMTKFYTAVYRVYSGPTIYSDVNGDFRSMKQEDIRQPGEQLPIRAVANVSDYPFTLDGQTVSYKTHYSGFSLWDTYRSAAQLVALIAPEANDMMQSLVVDAQQCGAFPHWMDGSEDTLPMQGDHALNVIAGSYAFGARHFDIEKARTYVWQSVSDPASACNDKLSTGREISAGGGIEKSALPEYLEKGYIATDSPSQWHSGSATIEMITSDRSAAAFLQAIGDPRKDDINALFTRSQNWKNLFNDEKKKIIPRKLDGSWDEETEGFHEGTEPHYIWSFAHDWTALIEKLGGRQAALDRLNTLFVFDTSNPFKGTEPTPEQLNSKQEGLTYYIGNQPGFATPWAYNWVGEPRYAQYILPLIMRKNFSTNPGGLPGNDDMGATSTWYIMAALGLYPVIPSEGGFAISTPQFAGATLWLTNGKTLRIETDRQAMLDDIRYIREMKLNDTVYKGSWLPYDKIAQGGKLFYTLSADPTDWGTGDDLIPPSGPNADYSQATAPRN